MAPAQHDIVDGMAHVLDRLWDRNSHRDAIGDRVDARPLHYVTRPPGSLHSVGPAARDSYDLYGWRRRLEPASDPVQQGAVPQGNGHGVDDVVAVEQFDGD